MPLLMLSLACGGHEDQPPAALAPCPAWRPLLTVAAPDARVVRCDEGTLTALDARSPADAAEPWRDALRGLGYEMDQDHGRGPARDGGRAFVSERWSADGDLAYTVTSTADGSRHTVSVLR